MALQLSLSSSPSIRSQNLVPSSRSNPISPPSSVATSSSRSDCSWLRNVNVVGVNPHGGRSRAAAPGLVRCSLDTATVTVGQVTEVDKDTFWPIVNAAGDKAVVLDMYTQWCGPCKIIAPKFQELSKKYLDVVFLKLDCNQDNKPLAKELGIRVVPTFKILQHGKIVKEVTGAKLDDLVLAIDSVRSG